MRKLAALALLALSACAPAQRGAGGEGVPTLVSLNPCTDAILAEVADPAQILALSSYSSDPASSSMDVALAKRWPATRGTVEELVTLRPDVVVSGNFIAPSTRSALGQMGMKLAEVPIANNVEQSRAQVRQLSALAGHPERGERLVARIDAALAAARPADARAIPAIVWQSGGIVPGGDTLITDLLQRTGFASLSAQRGFKQADLLPLERMLADPPRVIFATSRDHSGEDRMLGHPALRALKSTRREQLEPALLWCGGPTIPRAVARLAEARRAL